MFDLKLYAEALERIPQRYLLVNAMAMRIRQLQGGVEPLVEPANLSLFDIALKEIVQGKIQIRRHNETKELLLTTES
jgi:DNA-directed RNA polymerase omega subunit